MLKLRKQTGEIRLRGQADADGVAFEAYKLLKDGEQNFQGYMATLNKKGEISTKPFKGLICYSNIDNKINQLTTKGYKVTYVTVLVLILLSIVRVFIPWVNHYIFLIPLGIIASMSMLMEGIVILVAKFRGDEEIKSFLKFLTAMNSCRNAYYKLDRVPTVEDARKYLPISSESKYLRNTYLISYILFLIVMETVPNITATIIVLLGLVVSILIERKGKICYWQLMIYSKPDQIHYETAIRALEACLDEVDEETILNMFSEEECKKCSKYPYCKSVVDKRQS